jgi:hypothetical protein
VVPLEREAKPLRVGETDVRERAMKEGLAR